MIGLRAKTQDMTDRVAAAAERAARGNLRANAFLVMVDAKSSILKAPKSAPTTTLGATKRNAKGQFLKGSGRRKRKKGQRMPSAPGTPPFTDRGLLPRSIGYAVDGNSAVVGTQHSIIGTGGEPHEGGGEYKGDQFPDRSFMWPALERKAPIFGRSFSGSIGNNFTGTLGA